MSDKKKSSSSIFPFFVDGEQPTANKFNSISIQTRANLYVLEKTIGDIWAESEPYVSSTNRKLSGPISKKGSFELSPGTDERGYSLNLPSLGRLIGPISKLNPFNLTEGLSNGRVNVDLERDIIEQVTESVYSFSLKYPGTTILSFTGSGAPTNSVSSSVLLSSAGDYFYDSERSVVYFYDKSGPDWFVEYTTIPSQYSGGSSYTGSSANLIPDEAYMESQGLGVVVTLNGDYYSVQIPSIAQQNITSGEGVVLNSNEINYGAQLKLPNVLRALYGSDFFDNNSSIIGEHLIPEGFLYLKNYTTGELYTEGEYYYVSDTEIKIIGIQIDNPSTDIFCIATIGTDITSSIQDLKLKQFHHSHSREFGEPLIPINSIGSITDVEGSSGPFTKSEEVSNFAPQYLHRDGYRATVDSGLNDNNAMRGDLLIGKSGGSAGSYVGSGSSYNLYFGDTNTSIARAGTKLSTHNEGNIESRGFDLNLFGDNGFNSISTDSNFLMEKFTDCVFLSQSNRYRSSATQRPGKFEFMGAPVYLNGLDSVSYGPLNGGVQAISNSSLRLASSRDEAVRDGVTDNSDYIAKESDWFCPGIGIASIYLNDVKFNVDQNPNNDTNVLPAFYRIPLPKIGPGWEDEFSAQSAGNVISGIDNRITVNQIMSINVLIKPKSSNCYYPINGAPQQSDITLGHRAATYNLEYQQAPDSNTEYITIYMPFSNTEYLAELSAIDSTNFQYPLVWKGDERVDLRVTIMYLTHR